MTVPKDQNVITCRESDCAVRVVFDQDADRHASTTIEPKVASLGPDPLLLGTICGRALSRKGDGKVDGVLKCQDD